MDQEHDAPGGSDRSSSLTPRQTRALLFDNISSPSRELSPLPDTGTAIASMPPIADARSPPRRSQSPDSTTSSDAEEIEVADLLTSETHTGGSSQGLTSCAISRSPATSAEAARSDCHPPPFSHILRNRTLPTLPGRASEVSQPGAVDTSPPAELRAPRGDHARGDHAASTSIPTHLPSTGLFDVENAQVVLYRGPPLPDVARHSSTDPALRASAVIAAENMATRLSEVQRVDSCSSRGSKLDTSVAAQPCRVVSGSDSDTGATTTNLPILAANRSLAIAAVPPTRTTVHAPLQLTGSPQQFVSGRIPAPSIFENATNPRSVLGHAAVAGVPSRAPQVDRTYSRIHDRPASSSVQTAVRHGTQMPQQSVPLLQSQRLPLYSRPQLLQGPRPLQEPQPPRNSSSASDDDIEMDEDIDMTDVTSQHTNVSDVTDTFEFVR